MKSPPDLLCIGATHWDLIARTPVAMRTGDDVPGEVIRRPGGVAMNIAVTLARDFGLRPALLSVVGLDPEGEALLECARGLGLDCDWVLRSTQTDCYLAIEDPSGLVAAVADARALELAGARILAPLADGRLGSRVSPWPGLIVVDGNLSAELLLEIAVSPLFAAADLRVAAASPAKATRLRPMLACPGASLYLNLNEASMLAGADFADAAAAAGALIALGARRVLVTDGPRAAADASAAGVCQMQPPQVCAQGVTGAGDTFMATHLVAERRGADRELALKTALAAAARHVAGVTGS